jgi:hypothetical protein
MTFAASVGGKLVSFVGELNQQYQPLTEADYNAMGWEDADQKGITQTEMAQRTVRNLSRLKAFKSQTQRFDEEVRKRLNLKF